MIFEISPTEEVGDFEVKAKFMGVQMETFMLHYQVRTVLFNSRVSSPCHSLHQNSNGVFFCLNSLKNALKNYPFVAGQTDATCTRDTNCFLFLC